MSFVELNGAAFCYERRGKGQDVVLISGYTADRHYWYRIADCLAHHFNVLTFDNRAVGESSDEAPSLNARMMADDVIGIIEALGLENPHIIGQSMGGTIAQMVGIHYGEMIDKLVILNSTCKWNRIVPWVFNNYERLLLGGVTSETLLSTLMPWIFSGHFMSSPEKVEAFMDFYKKKPSNRILESVQRQKNVLDTFDATEDLAKIKNETLLVYAEEDRLALPRDCIKMSELISGAKLMSVDTGHDSPTEDPALVSDILLSFL